MSLRTALVDALAMAGTMTWTIMWSLILGFSLSAVVQAVVRRDTISGLLGDDRPATLAKATGLGIASSSCSYAAVALARSLFRKGAAFTSAMIFEFASTNVVIELGIILALLMGWQFTLAEFVGGPIMIVLLALAFRVVVRKKLIEESREQAERGWAGSMEGHAAMDMSVQGEGSFARRLFSAKGATSVSHIYVMEWAAVLRDIVIVLLIAGAVAAWVPDSFWQTLFLTDQPTWSKVWGPIIGPIISILSLVCSIGIVPLAAVLYSGGISFGGVVSFIFADLIIIPILVIYRKYYGTRMMLVLLVLLGVFPLTMVPGGHPVELLFGGFGLVPDSDSVQVTQESVAWNYTTILNIVFLLLSAALLARFVRTGGREMLAMMGGSPDGMGVSAHGGHDETRASRHDVQDPSPDAEHGHRGSGHG